MCFLIEPKAYSVPYAESASLTRHSKMDGSTQDGRNGKSRTCSKNGLECGNDTAIHPLVETTWLLRVLYSQVKMSIENQLEHEG